MFPPELAPVTPVELGQVPLIFAIKRDRESRVNNRGLATPWLLLRGRSRRGAFEP